MLQSVDEFMHVPPDPLPPSWQENFFFICWDMRGDQGLLIHIQRVPSTGLQEAQIAVAVDGQLSSATAVGPFRLDQPPPGVIMEPEEPFAQWRLGVEFDGSLGQGPLGFVGLGAGTTSTAADLNLRSELEPADFAEALATMVAGMRADSSGPQMGDQQHYEQGGTWSGTLRIGDREVTGEGLFVRDHSWGIRHEHQDFRAFWTASSLDDGRVFCNAIGIPRGGEVIGVGVVVDRDGARFTDDVAASFDPAPGLCSYDRALVAFGEPIGMTMTTSTHLHLPVYLPHSGPRRYDNNAISTVELDGASGFGVIEWAAVLTDVDDAQVAAAYEEAQPVADPIGEFS